MFDLIPAPTLLAYLGLVVAISVAPGPNVLFVMTQSAWRGPRAGLFAAAGIETANSLYVLFSAIGLAGLIAASGAAFEIIKWAGAAYLAWLGFQAIRSSFSTRERLAAAPGEASAKAFRDGMMVGLGNPKTILFFLALFPQFIDPAQPVWAQSLVLGAPRDRHRSCRAGLYALAGGMLSQALRAKRVKRWFERGDWRRVHGAGGPCSDWCGAQPGLAVEPAFGLCPFEIRRGGGGELFGLVAFGACAIDAAADDADGETLGIVDRDFRGGVELDAVAGKAALDRDAAHAADAAGGDDEARNARAAIGDHRDVFGAQIKLGGAIRQVADLEIDQPLVQRGAAIADHAPG